jgi:CBS domain containing-hemolysin-like protein
MKWPQRLRFPMMEPCQKLKCASRNSRRSFLLFSAGNLPQTARMATAVAAILIFAGASFFFALAETALFSLSKWQARQLAEHHPGAGKIVAQLLERPQDLLATLALGNTFANAAMLAVALRMVFNAHWALALTIATLLVLTLLGCEVLPKTLAVRRPERWALRVAWLMLIFEKITAPLHRVAQQLNAAILKIIAPQAAPIQGVGALTDSEYQELLEMAYRQGTLDESEKEIILQIISLDQRTVRDVMRPRAGMACISDDARRGNDCGGEKIQAPPPADLRRNAGHHRGHSQHARAAAGSEN